jgi:hypothetical protein
MLNQIPNDVRTVGVEQVGKIDAAGLAGAVAELPEGVTPPSTALLDCLVGLDDGM